MAREQGKAGVKSETLTIRLDPKTRFILDFISKLKGQTITTVVERAIVNSASQEAIVREGVSITWQDLWSTSEGVRTLALASLQELYPTFEDDRRLAFAQDHWPFFYRRSDLADIPTAGQFQTAYIDVLWPRLEEFMRVHAESADRFAAGKAMAEALKEARLKAPDWPMNLPTLTPVDFES